MTASQTTHTTDATTPRSVLIKNGRVISPPNPARPDAPAIDAVQDIAIKDGRIVQIARNLPEAGAAGPDGEVIDAEGMIVCPGLIDPHVHLREPGQEHKCTIASGTRAARRGGFTTVCCMPNTAPAIDSPEMVRAVTERARETAACRVFPVAAATIGRKGETLTEIALAAEAGAVAISDDGDVIESAAVMRRVLIECAAAGLCFMQHCQETTLTRGSVMNAGDVATRLGLTGWPKVAEEIIIDRDVRLVESLAGGTDPTPRYHVQHMSSAGSVDIVRAARERGLPVTAEASPHHLLLTDEAVEPDAPGGPPNTNAKMNPPLRTAADAEALRQAVAEGVVTVLATDHAPHTRNEKEAPFEDAPFGVLGLETALPAYAEALVHTGLIDWPRLIALLTIEPARLCNLDRLGLGALTPGGPADITIIDPEARWTVTEADLEGPSVNSCFLGREFVGRAVRTLTTN